MLHSRIRGLYTSYRGTLLQILGIVTLGFKLNTFIYYAEYYYVRMVSAQRLLKHFSKHVYDTSLCNAKQRIKLHKREAIQNFCMNLSIIHRPRLPYTREGWLNDMIWHFLARKKEKAESTYWSVDGLPGTDHSPRWVSGSACPVLVEEDLIWKHDPVCKWTGTLQILVVLTLVSNWTPPYITQHIITCE